MARYWVTGATGFLGQHVTRALLDRGDKVVALCRQKSKTLAEWGATVALGDVLEPETLARAAAGCDGVFHCAGLVSRRPEDAETMFKIHVDGTRHVLEAAHKAGLKRAVVASTSGTIAVSADPEKIASENDPTPVTLIARWPYYRSKLYAEELALQTTGIEVVAVNPSLLLGPGDARESSTHDVALFLRRKIQAVPAGGISFVDVRDAAQAMLAAMSRGRPGERYLVGACNLSVRMFFDKLQRLSGVRAPWLPLPRGADAVKTGLGVFLDLAARAKRPIDLDPESVDMAQHYWYCDWSKAERELGFAPRDPDSTLRDTVVDVLARLQKPAIMAQPSA